MLNLDKNKKYLLACSFGPDSMALFDMLLKEGYRFSVAHVNYHLRIESDEEEINLREYCLKNNIGIYVKNVSENLGHSNLEKICRDIRYNFFAETIKNNNFSALLVAHQEDDLIETYLMQKQRKNLVNYFGIKEIAYFYGIEIIRPFLKYRKQELLIYCQTFNVPFAIDKTNLQDCFKRNIIRHTIVEKMDEISRKSILEKINNENQNLAKIFDTINQLKQQSINEYNRLSDIEFTYAIVLLGRKVKPSFFITKKQSKELRKVLNSDKPNISFEVCGLCFYKEYNHFGFRLEKDFPCFSYCLEKPAILDTPYFYLNFSTDFSNRNIVLGDFPLTIRNANPNDVFQIKNYSKTMRRLFIDWKMPQYLRKRWPIILNNKGRIVYVPRYQKDFKLDKTCNFFVKTDY